MSILSWFRRNVENPSYPLTPEALAQYIESQVATGAVVVNRRSVLGYPPIRRAVSLIANNCAKLPLSVLKYNSKGDREKDWRHPGYLLLNDRPNPWQTPFVFKRELLIDAILLFGCAYVLRDEYGTPLQLLHLDPDQTTLDDTGPEPIFESVLNNVRYRIPHTDVFYLPTLGGIGNELLRIGREALSLSLGLQLFAERFFKQGESGTTYIELPPSLANAEKRRQFLSDWRASNAGAAQAHKTKFVPTGAKITGQSTNNEDSQLLQSRQFDLVSVANLIGVEPHKLGSQVATSYSSLKEQSQAFLDDCLDPWLVMIEEECNAKLRTTYEQQIGSRYFEFERKALVRMDPAEEINLVIAEVNNGLVSEEQGRRILNLPEKDNEEVYRWPSNLKTSEDPEPQPPAPPQPPQQPQDDQQPQEQDQEQEPQEDTARALTRQIVGRLLRRVQKGVENGKTDLAQHREVFLDHLAPIPNATTWTDQLLSRMQAEIDSALPEQFDAERYSTTVEELWTR